MILRDHNTFLCYLFRLLGIFLCCADGGNDSEIEQIMQGIEEHKRKMNAAAEQAAEKAEHAINKRNNEGEQENKPSKKNL